MSPFLLVSIVLFAVWSALFLFSRSTRREQAVMSIIGGVLSPGVLMVAAHDARSLETYGAPVGVEDLLFSFCLFGIAAVIYQALLGKHTAKWRGDRYRIANPAMHWFSHLLIIFGIWAFISLVMSLVFALSTVQGIIIGGLLIGTYIVADRKDLLLDALLSGILVAILVFLTEQLFFARLFPDAARDFWQIENISGILLGGIPVEEILWAAVVGFAVGPVYEYIRRYRLL